MPIEKKNKPKKFSVAKQITPDLKKETSLIRNNALIFAFIVASIATLGSLYFSEIKKFAPCSLCWYQRVFMYPQALILGIALLKNDYKIKTYILPLSIIGLLFAIYQYFLQLFPTVLPCSANEFVPCTSKYIEYFGFLTIPLMSAIAFILIIIFTLIQKTSD